MRILTIICTIILILAATVGFGVSLMGGQAWLYAMFSLLLVAFGYILVTLLDE
jgi:hypothetical protein